MYSRPALLITSTLLMGNTVIMVTHAKERHRPGASRRRRSDAASVECIGW